MRPTRAILLLLAGIVAATTGCNQDAEDARKKKKRPTVKVNLPPSPKMTEKRFVARYSDGSYRVEGLLKDRAKLMGKDQPVKVHGFIKKVYRCPDERERCDPPEHAVLVDDLVRPGKHLVVVGGPESVFPKLEQGSEDTFEGYYQASDPSGLFIRMQGILYLPALPPTEGTDKEDSAGKDPTEKKGD